MPNTNIINTPLGPRELPGDVLKLFENVPTTGAKPTKSNKYIENGLVFEWFEKEGRLVSTIKPKNKTKS
jgi:hypothetical protein